MNYIGQDITGLMAIKLSIPGMSGSVRDKDAETIVAKETFIDENEVRVGKKLFDKGFWAEVQRLSGQIRKIYYAATSPWDDKGWRVIGAENWTKFKGEYDMLSQKLELAVYKILPSIAEQQLHRQAKLGSLYKQSDYPTEDEIKAKWTPKLDIEPIAKPADLSKDLRFRIAANEITAIKKQYQQTLDTKVDGAMDYAWRLAFSAVNRIVERTEAKDADQSAQFHETVISNALELAELLPGLNIASDPRMTQIAYDIKTQLNRTPADIKKFPMIRREVLAHAKNILSRLDSYMKGASNATNANNTNTLGHSGQDSNRQDSQGTADNHISGPVSGDVCTHDAVGAA